MPATEPPSASAIEALLLPDSAWTQLRVVSQTGSTNADLASCAAELPTGAVLIADHQECGRGRFTRSWHDTPGTAVAVSVLLRPTRPISDWRWLSLVAGMAISDGLREATGAGDRVNLKWPNDVLVDDKKICGILLEGAPGQVAVIGFGINVSMAAEELPVPSATSLLLAGLGTNKNTLIAAVLNRLDALVHRWERGEDLRAAYTQACTTMGRRVRVQWDAEQAAASGVRDAIVRGVAVGVDPTGALLVRESGKVRAFSAGDVVHLR